MRILIITPIVCVIVAGLGVAICKLTGLEVHPREMLFAGAVALIAAGAGSVPLVLARRSDQTMVAQAGLIATTVHLFVGIALAGVVILILKFGQPFTYWLFAFYGVTLIVVAMESVRLVKAAPSEPTKAASKN